MFITKIKNTFCGILFKKVCMRFVINMVRNNVLPQTHMKSAIKALFWLLFFCLAKNLKLVLDGLNAI